MACRRWSALARPRWYFPARCWRRRTRRDRDHRADLPGPRREARVISSISGTSGDQKVRNPSPVQWRTGRTPIGKEGDVALELVLPICSDTSYLLLFAINLTQMSDDYWEPAAHNVPARNSVPRCRSPTSSRQVPIASGEDPLAAVLNRREPFGLGR